MCGKILHIPLLFTKKIPVQAYDLIPFCTFPNTCSPLKWEKAMFFVSEHSVASPVVDDGRFIS